MKKIIKITFSPLNILLIILLSMGLLLSCEADKRSSGFTNNMNPVLTSEQFTQASRYLERKEYDKAISSTTEVLKTNPYFAFGCFNRGMAYMFKGETDKALADYNKAIELDPNFSQYYLMRGTLFCYMYKNDECLADRNRAIELEPGNQNYYFQRGKTYLDTDNFDQAISDFTRSIELNPNSPAHIYYFRGKACMMKQLLSASKDVSLNRPPRMENRLIQ